MTRMPALARPLVLVALAAALLVAPATTVMAQDADAPTGEPAPTTTTTVPVADPEVPTTVPEPTPTTVAPTPSTTLPPTTTTVPEPALTAGDVNATAGLTGVVQVVAGKGHSCARLGNGKVKCWGRNASGQLGDGTFTQRLKPTFVKNASGSGHLSKVTQLSAGNNTTCVRLQNSQVRCWGENFNGNVGDGTAQNRNKPVKVLKSDGTTLGNIAHVQVSGDHACARSTGGKAYCWGSNGNGQLGDGTQNDRFKAVLVKSAGGSVLTGVAQVVAGRAFSCARTTSGAVMCWGGQGLVGDGQQAVNRLNPVTVLIAAATPLGGATRISAGYSHACALDAIGHVFCWGSRGEGNAIGDGSPFDVNSVALYATLVSSVVPGGFLVGAANVGAGGTHTCVSMVDTGVRCWGKGHLGQMGNGTTTYANATPKIVVDAFLNPVGGVTNIASGEMHTCAKLGSGAICWGSNQYGQLGYGTPGTSSAFPFAVQA